MPKIKANTNQLLVELNSALERIAPDASANPFVNSPPGAAGQAARGISTSGIWTPEHQKAHDEVFAQFELDDAA